MLTRDGHGKRKKIRIRYDFFYGMNIIQLNIYTIVLFEILAKSMMCVSGFFFFAYVLLFDLYILLFGIFQIVFCCFCCYCIIMAQFNYHYHLFVCTHLTVLTILVQ